MINLQIKEPEYRGSAIRNHQNLSLIEISLATGMEVSLLEEFEEGTALPTAIELKALCELFNVSASYLMGTNNINGNIEHIYREESILDFIAKIAEKKNIDLKHFADSLFGMKNLNVSGLLYDNVLSFNQLYLFAVALDVSLDYLLGLSSYENWIDWARVESPTNLREKENSNDALSEREYYTKYLQDYKIHRLSIAKKSPFGLLLEKDNLPYTFFVEELNLSKNLIYEWMSTPLIHSLDNLTYVAKYFNVNCSYLLGLTYIKTPNVRYEMNIDLTEQMKEANISLADFKELCNINSSTIKHINNMDLSVKIKKYLQIADVLNVSIDYLLGLTPYKNWDTDYIKAINPVKWITKGTAVNVYNDILDEPIDTLLCIEKTNSKAQCISKDGETFFLTPEYTYGKQFVELYPII